MNRSVIYSKHNSNVLLVKSLANTHMNRSPIKKANVYCSSYCWLFITLTFVSSLLILIESYNQLSIGLYQQNNHINSRMKYLIDHSKENLLRSFSRIAESSRIFTTTTKLADSILFESRSYGLSSSTQRKKRLAYVITITKDGFFQDGAAVLAYSIIKYSLNASEIYDISFIAFVHPQVQSSRPGLAQLGFHIIEVPTPVNSSAIKFEFLRDHIDKNGCCGAAELIKLTSYKLVQYHRVIHLDADTMFLNPIHELFERNFSLIYTTDPNMATHKGEDKMPVQGGFIVLQPNIDDYRNTIDIVMNTEFRQGSGWNRSKIGWFWGGMTVQGVLPYYYNLVTAKGRRQIVDRCYYNTMADTPECMVQKLAELKSAHFTVCQKPWKCYKAYVNPLCKELHLRWFKLRQEAEQFYNIISKTSDAVLSACPRGGPQNYRPMNLLKAQFPINNISFFVPDDSPNVFYPIPEAGYILGSKF